MVLRMIAQTLGAYGAFAALLFLGAGTASWPAAWVFLGEMALLSLAAGLWLARSDPALLEERMRPPLQIGQTVADRRFMVVLLVVFPAWLALMGVDARRLNWSAVPPWAEVLGAGLLPLAVALSLAAMRENSFAALVVRIQSERGQRVISTGPYRWVRHPMYAAGLLFFLGTPLLLGSWWGLAGAAALAIMLAVRIGIEETALEEGFPEYRTYAAQVRWRLIPGLW